MTAEIAVLNRDAVALAADSTVTVHGKKTYHTTNKLFALSRCHPIGIMFYGSAELGGIPWETLIKEFRKHAEKVTFEHLSDCQTALVHFLENEIHGFTMEEEEEIIHDYAERYLESLIDHLETLVEVELSVRGHITKREIKVIFRREITQNLGHWMNQGTLECASPQMMNALVELYGEKIASFANHKLENHKPSSKDLGRIVATVVRMFCCLSGEVTGIVLAGFGEKDLFPRASVSRIECITQGKLKLTESSVKIDSAGNKAAIMPFAQTEMVGTFMTGISPKMTGAIGNAVGHSFAELVNGIKEDLVAAGLQIADVESAMSGASARREHLLEELGQFIVRYQQEYHVNPVIEAVQYLPKNEMAEVAEALVSITSFRQKISLEQESVGGAIDVAVISKCDGFVWIKRKHYFEANLNPMFFSRFISSNGGR